MRRLVLLLCMLGAAGLTLQSTRLSAATVGAVIESRPFKRTVLLHGRMRASESEIFTVPMTPSWRLSVKWLAPEGSIVAPGDPVVRFDTGSLENELETAQIDLDDKLQENALRNAEASAKQLDLQLALEKAKIELEKAKIDAAVPRELLEGRKYDDAQLALRRTTSTEETARLALATHGEKSAAERRQRALDIENVEQKLARAREALGNMTLSAHRRGIVLYEMNWQTGRKVQIGDTLYASWPVASIPDLDSLGIEAFAGEAESASLTPGQPVRVVLDAYPTRAVAGTIQRVAKGGEVHTEWGRTPYYSVQIDLGAIDQETMRPGMSARCEVTVLDLPQALVVPIGAITRDEAGLHLRVAGKRQPIQLLGADGALAAITGDGTLKAGDQLDVEPLP